MPAPTRVTTNGTSTAQSAATATSLAVNYPTGSASGDLLILCVGTYRNATGTYTHTTPSGWTLLDNNNQSGASDAKNYSIFYRFRSSETSVTLNFSVAVTSLAAIAAYQGATVDATTPINVDTSAFDNTSSTGFTTPTATTTTGRTALLLWAFGVRAAATTYTFTWTSPATEILDASVAMSGISAAHGITAAEDTQATAGATGTRTATSSTAVLGHYTATIAVAGLPVTADSSLSVTAGPTADATRTANVDAPATITAGLTAAADRTANVDGSLTTTAGLTASGQRTQYATASTSVVEALTAAAIANYNAAADFQATAGLSAGVTWAGSADTALAVTVGPEAAGFIGPIISASITATASTAAAAERDALVTAATDVTVTATADVHRTTTVDADTTITAGVTAQAAVIAHASSTVTAVLTADVVVGRLIQAAPMVVTADRDARFSTIATTPPTTVTAAMSASAVQTAAGVKTSNGACQVTAGITAGMSRETRAVADTTVTVGLPITILADYYQPANRAVVAHAIASAAILGQPLPDVPAERHIYVTADHRVFDIPHEDRGVVVPAEDRALDIVRA